MEELERQLVAVFNNSKIPFEAKRYVVLKLARDVEDAYQNLKAQAAKKAQESEGNNDNRGNDTEG